MTHKEILLQAVLIPGIGPAVVEQLIKHLSRERLALLPTMGVADLQVCGLSQATAQLLVKGFADRKLLDTELARLERFAIDFIDRFDLRYPALLQHIHLPPVGLYVRGKLPDRYDMSLAVVGSRQASSYGQQAVDHIVTELAAHDWLIISGGALGADAFAHRATLRAGGKTIAVIGSGLLEPYPASHKGLFEEIVTGGGAVVSPFPLTLKALPGNFPARNRIIAGMARGCCVVQAAEKSGALITAFAALAEGREVGAVPGSIFDPLSAGCLRLLRDGAAPLTSASDVYRMLGLHAEEPVVSSSRSGNGTLAKHTCPQACGQTSFVEAPGTGLGQEADALVCFCQKPQSFDALLTELRLPESVLYEKLWELQVAGYLDEVGAGRWQATGKL